MTEPSAAADEPEDPAGDAEPDIASADPMESSIRSDEEKRRREQPDDGDDADHRGTNGDPDAPDPTDAPDLTGSALSRLSRFGLVGTLVYLAAAIAVVLLAILSPGRVSTFLGRGIGVVLVGGAIWLAVTALPDVQRRWSAASLLLGVAAVGVLLLLDPDRWLQPIGWIIGAVLVVEGVRRLFRRPVAPRSRIDLGGAALVAIGIAAALTFELLFETVAVVIALLAVASGVVGVAVRSGFTTVAPRGRRHRPLLVRWIDGKAGEMEDRQAVNQAVFFEGATAPARLSRFMLMMLFASVISGAGVLSDSTAVVIGAMLIAPLITPMMGMGLALVTGWPNRLGRSTLIVIAGAALAIGTGAVLAAVTDITVDLAANSQIVSRSSPRLIDLVIAIGAGAAGAYALCRKEASSSLPGVAVAIALVPPLSVVGVTAQSGDWQQAAGTLLLFLTNLVAIILAGGAVFLLTGVVPLRRFGENQFRVRTAFGAVVALAVVVVGGLVINGRQITADAFDLDQARSVVGEWLGDDTEFQVVEVDVTDGDVDVVLAGPGEPPSAQALRAALVERLGGDIRLELQWTPRQRVVVSGG